MMVIIYFHGMHLDSQNHYAFDDEQILYYTKFTIKHGSNIKSVTVCALNKYGPGSCCIIHEVKVVISHLLVMLVVSYSWQKCNTHDEGVITHLKMPLFPYLTIVAPLELN